MRSSAHVSEQTTVGVAEPAERERPEPVRIAHGDQPVPRQHHERERALHLRDRLDDRVLDARGPRPRVEVQDHLGVAARSGRSSPAATSSSRSSRGVDEVAVVADGDLAVRAVDQDRLRVGELALAGRRVAHVADRDRPGQLRERLARRRRRRRSPSRARRAPARRRRPRCRRSPARDAAARRGRGRSCWPLRGARRCRRHRTRLELVEHVSPAGCRPALHPMCSRHPLREVPLDRRPPTPARRPPRDTSTASVAGHARSAAGRRRSGPTTRAGTPAAAARASTAVDVRRADRDDHARRRLAEQRRGHCSAAPCRATRTAVNRHVDADAARVEAALGQRHRQPAVRAVVRRPHAAARRPASTSSACSARSAAEVERRRHAAHQAVHDLQVLAAAELAAPLAEQDDRVARAAGTRRRHARDRRARAGRRRR